jgi:hypothetical protein
MMTARLPAAKHRVRLKPAPLPQEFAHLHKQLGHA